MWRERLIRFILVSGVAILVLIGAKILATSWREKPLEIPKVSQKQIEQIEPLKEKVLGTTNLENQAEELIEQIKNFPQEQLKGLKNQFDQEFWGKFIEVEND
jgi:uncharacterized membrane protein